MKLPGDAEYRDLMRAASAAPALICSDDVRYISDDLDDATMAELQAGCDLCPVRHLCFAYAAKARPAGGFWAGRHWRRRTDDDSPSNP